MWTPLKIIHEISALSKLGTEIHFGSKSSCDTPAFVPLIKISQSLEKSTVSFDFFFIMTAKKAYVGCSSPLLRRASKARLRKKSLDPLDSKAGCSVAQKNEKTQQMCLFVLFASYDLFCFCNDPGIDPVHSYSFRPPRRFKFHNRRTAQNDNRKPERRLNIFKRAIPR